MSTDIIAIILAYLFGSISSAILVCRMMGLPDPRTEGSRNPGATNVLRIGGKKAAALTLLGDALKGTIPILIAKYVGLSELTLALVAFAAFFGHLLPIFFRFEGGKGVATLLGCLLALSWPTALIWAMIWVFIVIIFRYVSLASIIASLFAPILIYNFTEEPAYVIALIAMDILLVYRHRTNITNLIHGKEKKI